MRIVRIIPEFPGGLWIMFAGMLLFTGLCNASLWVTMSDGINDGGGNAMWWGRALSPIGTLILVAGVVCFWERKRKAYSGRRTADLGQNSSEFVDASLTTWLESQLDWNKSEPEWPKIAARLRRHSELQELGAVLICVGLVEIPDVSASPAEASRLEVYPLRYARAMRLILQVTIVLMVLAVVLGLAVPYLKGRPTNPFNIAYNGILGLGVLFMYSKLRKHSGAVATTRLELGPGIATVIESARGGFEVSRRIYPLQRGTVIVYRQSPLYVGDWATMTLLREDMVDSITLASTARTRNLLSRILANIEEHMPAKLVLNSKAIPPGRS